MKVANMTSLGALVAILCALIVIRLAMNENKPKYRPISAVLSGKKTTEPLVYSSSMHNIAQLDEAAIKELAKSLTPDERRILLNKGTEQSFCGTLLDNKKEGTYVCRLCGLPLFSSKSKFDSGTGWPSFFKPVDPDHIYNERDTSFGMVRTETQCMRCRSHLGHVFEDGPAPTGLRFCLNSAALTFYDEGAELPPQSRPAQQETAYFAGGCFWGIEDSFQQVPGVIDATSGYMGGQADNPTYREVCSGITGHAETVRVTFDSNLVSYEELLDLFFRIHDPTQLNRQGFDSGTQYRSAIFTTDNDQLEQARAFVEKLEGNKQLRGLKIVTQIESARRFYEAEEYHQDYHAKNGGSCPIPKRKESAPSE